MIASKPLKKASTPAPIPLSINRDRAGLKAISLRMESPDGAEAYNVLKNNEPSRKNRGMATINHNDHLPALDSGDLNKRTVIVFMVHLYNFILARRTSRFKWVQKRDYLA